MSQARLADALARLHEHHTLHLPLRRHDLLGRLALRFLWRRHLKWQMDVNLATRDAVDSLHDLVREQRSALDELEGPDRQEETRAGLTELRRELEHLRRSDENLMAGVTQRLHSVAGGIRTELSDLRMQLVDRADRTAELEDRLRALEGRLDALEAAAGEARFRHAQLDLFLDEARRSLPAETPTNGAGVPDRLARLELAVAELLDGPATAVRAQRAGYVAVVEAARERGAGGPVFDVLPWRGEWLEVLRSSGVPARAASPNPLVVRQLGELGLDVAPGEPLDALAELGRRTVGAVTAFRFVERLDPAELARFVDLAGAALQPGGALLIETPNPAGIAATDFHVDPLARRPVHPAFLRFVVEAAGFEDVEIRYLEGGPLAGWPADPLSGAVEKADRYCLTARR